MILERTPYLCLVFAIALAGVSQEAAFADKADSASLLPAPFENRIALGAHRGGKDEWPENTLLAFQSCAAKFPEALLEGDLHITSDGVVVVIHDATVNRTTDGKGMVEQMTFAELQELDAAYHFTTDDGASFPHRGKGVRVPALREVLEALPESVFMMEMKQGHGLAEATVAVIQDLGMEDRVILASVNPVYVNKAAELAPEIPVCYATTSGAMLLTTLRQGDWENHEPTAPVLTLPLSLENRFGVTPEEMQAIQAKGIMYQVFTLNDADDMRAALDRGVCSILTDKPTLLAEILAERDK